MRNKKTDAIYVIMAMTKLEEERGFPDFGAERVVGYYRSKEDARQCVIHNCGDIWETCYNYAVVERIEEGLYGSTHEREFFKFDLGTKEYKPYEEPEFLRHIVGLTMS